MRKGRYRPRSDGKPPANPSLYHHKPKRGRYRGPQITMATSVLRSMYYARQKYGRSFTWLGGFRKIGVRNG